MIQKLWDLVKQKLSSMKRGSKLVEHARVELEMAGYFEKDGLYDGMLGPEVLELVEKFSAQGHSGMSAAITLGLFSKVAAFEPLLPLTGKDEEWNETSPGHYQNRRCSHVFREEGKCFDISGIIFKAKDGGTYTSRGSSVPVAFPYAPHSEIREEESDGKQDA